MSTTDKKRHLIALCTIVRTPIDYDGTLVQDGHYKDGSIKMVRVSEILEPGKVFSEERPENLADMLRENPHTGDAPARYLTDVEEQAHAVGLPITEARHAFVERHAA